MPRKFPPWAWIMAGFALAVVVGFGADPVPQPQRVSDLVARVDGLEATNAEQAAAIEALTARVARLEAAAGLTETQTSGITPPPPAGSTAPAIPASWVEQVASDGVIAYQYDPRWELTQDEPGSVNFWIDDEHALLFSWDGPGDVMELLQEERFLELFEQDLLGDDSTKSEVVDSGPTTVLEYEGYYWEVALEIEKGIAARVLTVIYACSEQSSCNIMLMRLDSRDAFDATDRALLDLFASGITFLNVGKATVTANANLRSCPAVTCEVVGRAIEGEIIEVVGKSSDDSWYRLRSGAWIAASLVEGAPNDLPILDGGSEL